MHTLIYALGVLVLVSIFAPIAIGAIGLAVVVLPYIIGGALLLALLFADILWNHGAATIAVLVTCAFCGTIVALQNWHARKKKEAQWEQLQVDRREPML